MVVGFVVLDFACGSSGLGLLMLSRSSVSSWHPKVLPCRQGLQLVVCLWLCVSDCVIVCLWLWLWLFICDCACVLWSCCAVVCYLLRSGSVHCDLALAVEVRRGTLPSGTRS